VGLLDLDVALEVLFRMDDQQRADEFDKKMTGLPAREFVGGAWREGHFESPSDEP
jgi:hypothetical protein